MKLIRRIRSKVFQKKDQIDKRLDMQDYILNDSIVFIGADVLCFESKDLLKERDLVFLKKLKKRGVGVWLPPTDVDLTIGVFYKILDKKEGYIKVKNDKGNRVWYTHKRFVYNIEMLRTAKIKKLNEKNSA